MNSPNILLVNGNTTRSVTEKLLDHARSSFPGVTFEARTPDFGPAYVSTPADVAWSAHAVTETIASAVAEAGREPDACVIACFGEPGLAAARHRWRFPIVGMAEASVLTALQLAGRRYVIATAGRHWPAMLHDLLRLYALEQSCAGIVEVVGEPLILAGDPGDAVAAVQAAVDEAITRHQPSAIILGGASLVGLARALDTPVPVIDCLDAAVGQAIGLAAMRQIADRVAA